MKDSNFNSNLYSLLESSCKKIESLTDKNKSTIQSIPKPTTNQPLTQDPSNPIQKPRARFTVQSAPKEKFSLFEKNDFYHYERKFHNELPDVVIPPISFHLAHSNENFSNFDMKTMMFGLKGTGEILTDPRLNTKIHKDFIENSMNLIFPNDYKRETTELIEKSRMNEIKDEILRIIEAKEQTEEKEFKIQSTKSNASYYLRASTLLSSSLNLKKKNSGSIQMPGVHSIQSQGGEEKSNIQNLKKIIENSFRKIKNIEEDIEHPHKKNVYAKNVYNIQPFHQFEGEDFSQIIFPTDPLKEIETSGKLNEGFAAPDKFFIRKVNNEVIFEFYKREKLAEDEAEKNSIPIDDQIKKAELYSFEREYSVNFSNPCELFNRYLIFLDKHEKSANFVPIDRKLFLKKYKKVVNVPLSDMDEYGDYPQSNSKINQNLLNKKTERSIIVSAVEENVNKLSQKNQNLRENGVLKEFKRRKLDKLDYSEISIINEKKKLKQESQNIDEENEDRLSPKEEHDDLFGFSDREEKENFSLNDNHSEQDEE